MKIYHGTSLSVHAVVKHLVDAPDRTVTVQNSLKVSARTTPLKDHRFRVIENEGFGFRKILIYEAENNEGKVLSWRYYLDCRPVNLPNVDAVRWYIFDHRTSKLVQCLHLNDFIDGDFYFCRHHYRHLYASQSGSHRDRSLQYHDFERKAERLRRHKRKLRLRYAGQPTRTAKRLEYYDERSQHYEEQSMYYLALFVKALEDRRK